jgi:hypothetical protein
MIIPRFRDDYVRGMTLHLPVQKPLRSRPCVRFPLFARARARGRLSFVLSSHSGLLLSFWISICFFPLLQASILAHRSVLSSLIAFS